MNKYLNKKTGIIGAIGISILVIILIVSTQLSNGLTLDEAKNIAKAHIPASAEFISSEDDGSEIDVKFYDNTAKETYSIEVSKETKKVTEVDRELDNDLGSNTIKLDENDVKTIVNKTIKNITDLNTVLLVDDGLYIYETNFSGKDFRGDMNINPETGKITESTIKYGTKVTIPNEDTSDSKLITSDEAKDIAIKSQNGGKVVDIDLEKEKNQYFYEITIIKENMEIELLINASTKEVTVEETKTIDSISGATPSKPNKPDTSDKPTQTDKNIISMEKAKSIVLAKLSGANIIKLKLDTDDGIKVYEGKALLDKYEYEFEINASSGVITEWDKELQEKYELDDDDDFYDNDDDDDDDDDDDK